MNGSRRAIPYDVLDQRAIGQSDAGHRPRREGEFISGNIGQKSVLEASGPCPGDLLEKGIVGEFDLGDLAARESVLVVLEVGEKGVLDGARDRVPGNVLKHGTVA